MYGRIGSYNTLESQFTGSIANETFGFNASVYGLTSDGYRANNRNEQINYSGNMRWAGANSTLDLGSMGVGVAVRAGAAPRAPPLTRPCPTHALRDRHHPPHPPAHKAKSRAIRLMCPSRAMSTRLSTSVSPVTYMIDARFACTSTP